MPCLDCGSGIISGKTQKVYQPFPPPFTLKTKICLQLIDDSIVEAWQYEDRQPQTTDCDSPECSERCGDLYYTDLSGDAISGVVVDCLALGVQNPQIPGVDDSVCADASGTWTSPDCATQITIDVTLADATGPTLTIPPNPATILRTGVHSWQAQPGQFISPMTLTNNTVNQCSSITWMQEGSLPVPESWVPSQAGTTAGGESYFHYKSSLSFNGALYFNSNNGLWRYDDAGMSWTQEIIGNVKGVVELGGNIYANVAGQVQRSTDNGLTWANYGIVVPATNAGDLVVFNNRLYVLDWGSVNIYEDVNDDGSAWTARATSVPNNAVWYAQEYDGFLWICGDGGPGPNSLISKWDGAVMTTIVYPGTQTFGFGLNGGNLYHSWTTGGSNWGLTEFTSGVDAGSTVGSGSDFAKMISKMTTDGVDLFGVSGNGSGTLPDNVLEWDGVSDWIASPTLTVGCGGQLVSVEYHLGTWWARCSSGTIYRYQAAQAGSC